VCGKPHARFDRRGPETDSRRRLNGHEAGNGGHCKSTPTGTAPAPDPTIPLFCGSPSTRYLTPVDGLILSGACHKVET